ncbi:MAG TPA: MbcA/ParS/Xre antitoxin family protein, partial [Rubrivivax sp.]|nr:MbcA/ParS/Xre antitoxin family protein [Rubrivivax sp.]
MQPQISSRPSASDRPPVDLATPDAAAKALRVFFRLADEWNLSAADRQKLLGVSRSVFFRWQAGKVAAALDHATSERLSYIFRIYSALQVLLPVRERANAWIHRPNTAPLFGGQPALARMLAGQTGDLKEVADYLDAQRG